MKKYLVLTILIITATCLHAQNDTIFCTKHVPEMDSFLLVFQEKYRVIFEFGTIDEMERNYKTIPKIENKFGSPIFKLLIQDPACSREWKRFLKSQQGRRKEKLLTTKFKVAFKSFGLIKYYESESLYGVPDSWVYYYRKVEFDDEGIKIFDEKRQEPYNPL